MADRLGLGDLAFKLGFENEDGFLRELESVFKRADTEAGKAGKKSGSSFTQEFRDGLSSITIGAFLGSALNDAFQASVAAAREFARESVKEFATYEQGLIQLSLAGETNLSAVEERIKSLSETTKIFSETDISVALGELVKQGVSVERAFELVGQGAKLASSDVNSATGEFGNLTTASVQLGNVLEALKLSQEDTARVTDVLAKAAQDSGLSVQELVDIVVNSGPAADSAGVSLEELAGAAAVLSKNGLDASTIQAGLRGVIETMKAPAKEIAGEFERYGVNLIKTNGETRRFSEVLANLERVLQAGGRGAQFIARGFDSFQASVVTGLGQSATSINAFSGELNNAEGSAARLSSTITNITLGSIADMERQIANARLELGERLVPINVKLYESVLPSLVTALDSVIDKFEEWKFIITGTNTELENLQKNGITGISPQYNNALQTQIDAQGRLNELLKQRAVAQTALSNAQNAAPVPGIIGQAIIDRKQADLNRINQQVAIAQNDLQLARLEVQRVQQQQAAARAKPPTPAAPTQKPTSNAPITAAGVEGREPQPSAAAVQALLPQARALAQALEAANRANDTSKSSPQLRQSSVLKMATKLPRLPCSLLRRRFNGRTRHLKNVGNCSQHRRSSSGVSTTRNSLMDWQVKRDSSFGTTSPSRARAAGSAEGAPKRENPRGFHKGGSSIRANHCSTRACQTAT
ncbi:MAG: phage tail tape measure protein [Pleurocapsa sp. SU_196_0]|nr:phage tail tape measure protein [Pleurocapsa sp. SU_196_0]